MSMDNLKAVEPKTEDVTVRLTINKEQAMDLKVGMGVRFEVVGEVKDLTQCYNDKEQYDVVLTNPAVKAVEANGEKEEGEPEESDKENLATLPKEMFKKLLSEMSTEEGK